VEIGSLVDKRNIFLLFGCFCNKPELALRYETVESDYPESFHRIIFASIMNITMKGTVQKITPIDIENEISLFPTSLSLWQVNNGFQYISNAIEETEDMICNVEMYFDNVRKYSILRNAILGLKLDMTFVFETYDELDVFDKRLAEKKAKMEKFNSMTSSELLRVVNERFMSFNEMYKSHLSSNYGFHIGNKVDDIIEGCKVQDGTYGYGFQNQYFNSAFRGKKPGKYVVISRPTGHGKSRGMIGSASDLACAKLYDWEKRQWIDLGYEPVPILYVTSELNEDEVVMIAISHIAGIPEDRLSEYRDITPEEEIVIEEAKLIMKNSKFYCEYMEEFSIQLIEDMVRKYAISYGIYGLFFDYISENNGLYAESYSKTGMKLQSHQILLSLSTSLKLICNKYKLYLESSTQMNDSWKQGENNMNLDSSSIRGAKSISDKTDISMIGMKMSPKDYKKIDAILKSGFYKKPNYFYSCYKNRGNKLVEFLCFTLTDLGTSREEGLFCTTKDYELLDIEKTILGGFDVKVPVGTIHYSSDENEPSATDYVESYTESITKVK
jgi:hypothetical protein